MAKEITFLLPVTIRVLNEQHCDEGCLYYTGDYECSLGGNRGVEMLDTEGRGDSFRLLRTDNCKKAEGASL